MSLTSEREITEGIKCLQDTLEEHITDGHETHRAIWRKLDSLGRKVLMATIVPGIATAVIVAYGQVTAASAHDTTVRAARDETNLRFEELRISRDAELRRIADMAAKSAVNLVVLPPDPLRRAGP